MLFSPIISLIIVIYFVYDQFEFSRVTKIRFLFLPFFCLYQFITKFNFTHIIDLISIIIILLLAIGIGFYQSRSFKDKVMKIESRYFFTDQNGQEVNAYQKALYARGGRTYLVGWILIFLISLFLNGDFNENFNFYKFAHALVKEIIADLAIFTKLTETGDDWRTWELLGFANLAYLMFIRRKSTAMNSFFKRRAHEEIKS